MINNFHYIGQKGKFTDTLTGYNQTASIMEPFAYFLFSYYTDFNTNYSR